MSEQRYPEFKPLLDANRDLRQRAAELAERLGEEIKANDELRHTIAKVNKVVDSWSTVEEVSTYWCFRDLLTVLGRAGRGDES